MKNKITSMAVLLTMLIAMCTSFATVGAASETIIESPDVSIMIDGDLRSYQQVPIIVNGSTFLPLRVLATDLGIPNDNSHIIWNQADKSVTLKNADGSREVFLNIGKLAGKINGKEEKLNAAPVLYKNSTYIPVRFVADALEMTVLWDEVERRVYIRNAAEYEQAYTLNTTLKYPEPDANGDIKYDKTYSMKATADKSGTLLQSMEYKGNFKINVDTMAIKAELNVTYPSATQKVEYITQEDGIYCKDNQGTSGLLDKEKSTSLLRSILADIGFNVPDDEDSDTDSDVNSEEKSGLSTLERACLFTTVKETETEIEMTLPLHTIWNDGKFVQYNRVFKIDKSTNRILSRTENIKKDVTQHGITTHYEYHISCTFRK